MSIKIKKLTTDQKSRFAEWTKKWVDIGLSTDPADFDAATEAALKSYRLANLNKPMVILRMGSPYSASIGGAMAWMILRVLFKDQVRAQVGDQVRAQVGAQVRDQVGAQVWDQVRDQVWDQVGAQVWDQVRAQAWDQAKEGVNNYGYDALWGTGFASWVSFFRDVCGWEDPLLEKFSVLETLVKSCGWTWWHQNVLAISDRPRVISRDNENRLHCETGPSIAYPDGWSLFHWHGVSVPAGWIMDKQSLSAKTALTWENIEQRRAACEIVGWAKIMHELDARVIDEDGDPEVGILLEAEIPDSGRERFLKVLCGTGREFVLPVPPEMQTALEANAWTYGLDKFEYKPEVRT